MLCCTSPAHRLKQMHDAMPQNVEQPRPAACSKSSSHRSCVATPSSCSGTMAAVLLACSQSIMGDSDNADELYSNGPLSEADLQPCRPAACRDAAKPSTMHTHSLSTSASHHCSITALQCNRCLPAQSHTPDSLQHIPCIMQACKAADATLLHQLWLYAATFAVASFRVPAGA